MYLVRFEDSHDVVNSNPRPNWLRQLADDAFTNAFTHVRDHYGEVSQRCGCRAQQTHWQPQLQWCSSRQQTGTNNSSTVHVNAAVKTC